MSTRKSRIDVQRMDLKVRRSLKAQLVSMEALYL